MPALNQISAPSPEKPKDRSSADGASSGGMSGVRLTNCPVPTWLTQRSNCPSRSARNATNLPSGEISASPSVPSQSVKREKCALASGFSRRRRGATPPTRPELAASATSATHGSHVARVPRQRRRATLGLGARHHFVDRVDLDPDVADVAQPLLRDPSQAAEQEPANRRRGRRRAAPTSPARARGCAAIVSETVSRRRTRARPVSIS